jgi:hypothetical protein
MMQKTHASEQRQCSWDQQQRESAVLEIYVSLKMAELRQEMAHTAVYNVPTNQNFIFAVV